MKLETRQNEAFTLLSAIVTGDAAIEDGVAELRNEGIDSLDQLLAVLKRGVRERELMRADAMQPVSPLRARKKPSPELTARIVQRIPTIPFLLNGVMYDPQDITRFNGQELHTVATPDADHMLAIDDREVIESWWRLTYLERYRSELHHPEAEGRPSKAGDGQLLKTFYPRTWFYEHINLGGSQIYLNKNRGYKDLTEVSDGLFSDWNDKISSYYMIGTQVTVLHEHVNWTGQTHSTVLSYPPPERKVLELLSVGWNDRASSVETW
ncbi:MAG TPA: hypothetical protein VFV66_26095 [Nonomuraea sp.]|nr:hypothetical protein [Nonomuraea sp.]